MMPNLRIVLLSLAAAALTGLPVQADFVTISQPDPAYLAGTTLVDFDSSDFTLIGASSAKGVTLVYDNLLEIRTVADSWTSWGAPPAVETAKPRVGFTDGASSLTIALSHRANTFGFEIEPDQSAAEQTSASFFSGSTLVGTIELSPSGDSGALLFAASSAANPFTAVVITNLAGGDFAIARQRVTLVNAVPEPGTWALMVLALMICGGWQRYSRRSGTECAASARRVLPGPM